MTGRILTAASVALGAFLFMSPAAVADGPPPTPAPKCPEGQVYDEGQKKCVEKQAASPESLFQHAVRLARTDEDYTGALAVLATLDQNDPRVLNYIGFATRKSGDILKGVMYYYKALEIDPDYMRAREYLGEGYLQLGRTDLAREQLGEIERRCGTSCEEYQMLLDAIKAAKG